jgi:two-component system nitrate/nitrite response regulator NarL
LISVNHRAGPSRKLRVYDEEAMENTDPAARLNPPNEATRLYLVDDHASFRRTFSTALAAVPGFEVVGETGDVRECVRAVAALQPEVVLVDLHLPQRAALDAIAAIRVACPAARILVLTLSEQAAALSAALHAGADGYLVKNLEDGLLVSSVQHALNSAVVLAAAAAHSDTLHLRREDGERTTRRPHGGVPLSPREREILLRVARGESNKEVGRGLGVAESTVKIHVQHILRKLKLTSRAQAAVYAAEHGLLPREA